MATLQQYYDYSTLSLAAYAEGLVVGGNINEGSFIEADFTDKQFDQFIASGWEVVSQSSDLLYGDSGFSATLFHNTQTDEYVFANRGTGDVQDLFTDAWGIALLGSAGSQTIDMYRYYKQLITPAGQAVSYTADEIDRLHAIGAIYAPAKFLLTSQVESYLAGDIGLGKLQSSQQITTTGHSLGGFLSTWLNALIPSIVDHVYTYNGAGLGGTFPSLFTLVNGIITGAPITRVDDADVTNLYAYGDIAVISGVGGSVGQNFPVNIEYKTLIDGTLDYVSFYNHSIVQLTDSIAVANLLSKLDSNITTSKFNDFFDKSSNKIGQSLEGLLDGVRNYFGMTNTTENDNRPQFYDHLLTLQNSPLFTALIGKVTLVAPPTTAGEARNDFGAFLSLFYLTPFALKTSNAEANNLLLAIHTALGDKWTDDYNLSDEAKQNGDANFSDTYLADRAAMLSWKLKFDGGERDFDDLLSTGDKSYDEDWDAQFSSDRAGYVEDDWDYIDHTFKIDGSPIKLTIDGRGDVTNHQIVFGDIEANTLDGDDNSDRLYGMGGDDTINGGDGNDYIEGNSGQDTLKGEEGNDILLGGRDVDILDGGTGNDILKGGEGVDVYQFTGDYGFDVITDSDGQGIVTVDNNPMTTSTKQAENIYKQEGTGYTFTKVNGGSTIIISKEGDANRIIVNEWSDTKNLSISLEGDTPAAPDAVAGFTGDFKKLIDDHGTTDTSDDTYVMDDNGNYTRDPDALNGEPGAADLISGTDAIAGIGGKDVIYGLGGSDALSGKSGDDYIDGGSGGDVIQGGLGKDTLNGGAGDDLIYGSSDMEITKPTNANFIQPVNYFPYPQATGFNWTSGSYGDTYPNGVPQGYTVNAPRNRLADDQGNIIDGGAGNDFIAAGTGADYVHGGADKDLIWGMDKDDILFGDGDNDVIYGDGDNGNDSNSVVWTLAANHGNDIIDGGDGDDIIYGQGKDDIIFGGNNNDEIRGDDTEANLSTEFHGNDYLDGGIGNDTIYGNGGDDTLIGGTGSDTIYGGTGNDTYIYNVGDGVDYLYDDFTTPGANTLRFGVGVNPANVKLGKGSLLLDLGNGDQIHIEGFNTQDVYNTVGIGSFEFADGTVLTSTELLARGFDLDGTANNDTINGTNITDRVNGLAGNDTLVGFGGDDVIWGGTGDDIIGGDGDELALSFHGNDELHGEAGNDYMSGGGGNDLLNGGDNNDTMFGDGLLAANSNGADTLDGGTGNDYLDGQSGDDNLSGGAGNDTVLGGSGDDTLDGGTGVDSMTGGTGNDTYIYNAGDGVDYLNDDYTTPSVNTLKFGVGIDPASITLSIKLDTNSLDIGALLLDLGNGDQIYIKGINKQDIYSTICIGRFEFSDGTILTSSELLARGININGTNGNDAITYTEELYWNGAYYQKILMPHDNALYGTNAVDRINGLGGNDLMIGRAGNDTLIGGTGNDYLKGETGNDTYLFNLGDGQDTIYDSDSTVSNLDTIRFSAGIAASDITFARSGNNLVLGINGTSNQLTIQNWGLGNSFRIERMEFADGKVWDATYLQEIHNQIAALPLVGTALSENLQAWSGGGNATLQGLGGHDVLSGNDGNDYLDGGTGSDTLSGYAGDDTLKGGGNNDRLFGDRGNDTYMFNLGDGQDRIYDVDSMVGNLDTIRFGAGIAASAITFTRSGNDMVLGIMGTSDKLTIQSYWLSDEFRIERVQFADGTVWNAAEIQSQAAATRIVGTVGNDYLQSPGGNSIVYGLGGNDVLTGSRDNDILSGGTGNDWLQGWLGNDTYLFNLGDGQDTIYEQYPTSEYDLTVSNVDTIRFGAGIAASDIIFTRAIDGLELSIHGTSDRLTTEWFNGLRIERVEFADGLIWDEAQLKTKVDAASMKGSADDDYLFQRAAGVSTSLQGLDGDDRLYGNSGNDTLDGGTGNDALYGSIGDDTYLFNLGNGQDTIYETGSLADNVDTIRFGEGIATSDIAVTRNGYDLVLSINGTNDQLTVLKWATELSSRIERMEFADGTVWDKAYIKAIPIIGMSGNDLLSGGIEGNTYLFNLGGGQDAISEHRHTVLDQNVIEGDDTIRFGAGIAASDIAVTRSDNGADLVLRINGTSDQLTIQSWGLGDSSRIERVEFSDGMVWDTAYLQPQYEALPVIGTNENDYLYGGIGNTTYLFGRGSGQDFVVWEDDSSVGNIDVVRMAADILPSDVSFSGTVWGDLVIAINDTSDTLTIGLWFASDDSKIEQISFAEGTVWDVSDIMSRTPASSTEGDDFIFATSGNNNIDALGGNDAVFGSGGNDVLDGGSDNDYMGGNAGNDILRGGDGFDDVEDWEGNNYLDGGVDDDYIYAAGSANFILGGTGSDYLDSWAPNSIVAFNRGDGNDTIRFGQSLTISLGGGIHTFDLVLSKNRNDYVLDVGNGDSIILGGAGATTVTLQLIDGAIRQFDLSVILQEFDQAQAQDSSLAFWQIGTALESHLLGESSDHAIGGDIAYQYAIGGNAAMPTDSAIQAILSDPDFGVQTQALTPPAPQNTAPAIVSPLPDVQATEYGAFTYQIPAGTIIDQDNGDILSYSATLADGSALPSWLAFDATTQTFSGTPAQADVGNLQLVVMVTDTAGASVQTGFTLLVANVNDVPVAAIALDEQMASAGALFQYGLPINAFTDADPDDQLTYTATLADGSALPSWLGFDAATISFSGMPGVADAGELQISITATDIGGMTAALSFGLTVQPGITLIGGSGDDILMTGIGNDMLDGGAGADSMSGGAGDDLYVVDNADDLVVEAFGEGVDSVQSSVDYTLGANLENLVLIGDATSGTGNALNNAITANVLGNYLSGQAGDDSLIGGLGDDVLDGGTGADAMTGGAGNDTYVIDEIGDQVNEAVDAGIDTIEAGINYVLDDQVENLVLTGSTTQGRGNALDNHLTGNDLGNTLSGEAGNDSLVGGAGDDQLDGGTGVDTMAGGAGNDTYYVDDTNDVIVENLDAGTDHVQSGVTYTLSSDIETLTLTGSADIDATGNSLDNVIQGNDGANVLNGAAGADSMAGGLGNDTYVVDNALDSAIESLFGGTDTVLSSISYSLDDNFENLTFTGSGNLAATGNSLDNTLQGNSGDNLLNGGIGADSMAGGDGNDAYIVDDAGDLVIESEDAGVDTVLASVTYTALANVENLALTGSADINATGNYLANLINGNTGSNVLDGGDGNDTLAGSGGNDVLLGGQGDDTYYYNLGDGLDEIVDIIGIDTVYFGTGLTSDNVVIRIVTVDDQEIAQLRLLDEVGNEIEDQGFNFAITYDENGDIVSPIEKFISGDGEELVVDDLVIKQTTLYDSNKVDTSVGDRNDNTIFGVNGQDTIYGYSANDTLYGQNGADVLYGGVGKDKLYGGNNADILYGESGHDLLNGEHGADDLYGGAGNDTLSGGLGKDVINGGSGDDTYLFARGDGIDALTDSDVTPGNSDTLRFGVDVAYNQLWFTQAGNNLEVSVIGTTDKVVIQDWYLDTANHVEQINTADGSHVLLDTQVQNLVNAMAGMTPPAAGQTTLPPDYQTQLAPVLAANWQ